MKRIIILLLAVLMGSATLYADVNVLIVGSTQDTGNAFGGTSDPFSPTDVATHLDSILSGAGLGPVNVTLEERYAATTTTLLNHATRCYNLASWYHWPTPAGYETTNRWPNLRGELDTAWDYVVLIGDPYTMEYTPGMYALGVGDINDEVSLGTAQTILLMPWPSSGSASSVAHYEEVVYRTGRSGNIKVAPGALAWQACGSPSGGSHPNSDGAYIAAASIYSRIYGQSATNSSYSHNDTHADLTYTATTNAMATSHYTGLFDFQNPYLILDDKRRDVHFSEQGTSTEEDLRLAVGYAMNRVKVSNDNWSYNDKYVTENPDTDNMGWPVGNPMPIGFNIGRTWPSDKAYKVNSNFWQLAFGYVYHFSTWGSAVDLANDYFIGMMYLEDNALANTMLGKPPTARNLPMRTIWAQIHKEYPTWNPLRDGSGPHLNANFSRGAIGDYMYTIYSGRCSVDPSIDPASSAWMMQKIGYETAWRLGRCQVRAPGLKVTPTSAGATAVTPSSSETLTVQFLLAPTSDVEVAVSVDDSYAGLASPSVLTFTPANYSNAQTVTVWGKTGAAGTYPFNVTLTASSDDPVYQDCYDTWDFSITRSDGPVPSDIKIYGDGLLIINGDPTAEQGNGTDYGYVAVPGEVVSQIFVITNEGGSTVDLTNSPAVTLTGGSGQFTVTQPTDTSLAAAESTTFTIEFDPASGGIKSAIVTVASTDTNISEYIFAIEGFGVGVPTVGNETALSTGTDSASLNGTLNAGAVGDAFICWGAADGGTLSTSDWDNVESLGYVLQDAEFQADLSELQTNVSYWFRCFVTNAAGADWSDTAISFSGTPDGVDSVSMGWSYTRWNNDGDADITNDYTYIAKYNFGNDRSSLTINGVTFDEGSASSGTGWSIGGSVNTWLSGDVNSLSGNSALLADDFVYAGNPRTIQFTDLVPGESYIANLYSVAWGSDHRGQTFSASGGTSTNISQNVYGDNAGIRISYVYTVTNTVQDISILPDDSGTFHLYALSNYELPELSFDATILTLAPTSISNNSAVFNAGLNSKNSTNTVYVHWDTVDRGTNLTWANSVEIGVWTNVAPTNLSYTADIGGGTAYFYTFRAVNATGTVWASHSWRITTLPGPPLNIQNRNAEDVTGISAAFKGVIFAPDTNFTVYVHWNTIDGLEDIDAWTNSALVGSWTNVTSTNLSFWKDGLTEDTQYYYTFRATNDSTIVWATPSESFTTLTAPQVNNDGGATDIAAGSATLRGNLAAGVSADAWICWGTSDAGTGSTGDWQNVESVGSVSQGIPFSRGVSGLDTNVTYWYRCYAGNASGTDWSDSAAVFNGEPGAGAESGGGSGYRMQITFTNFAGRGVLPNFPALVKLTTGNTDSYTGFLDATDGWDLRFWDSEDLQGTELKYEMESFDSAGTSYIWVKIPELTNNLSIWASWGDASKNFQEAYTTNGDVWSEGYGGVWHLNETSGTHEDSTANDNDGTYTQGSISQSATSGRMAGGVELDDGWNTRIDCGNDSSITPQTTLTLSCWIYMHDAEADGYFNIVGNRSGDATFMLYQVTGGRNFRPHVRDTGWRSFDSADATVGQWLYVAMVGDGSTMRLWVDMVRDAGSAAYTPPLDTVGVANMYIGDDNAELCFDGLVDEVRISSVARSSNWMWACWMNQGDNHSSFSEYGIPEALAATAIRNLAPASITDNSAVLNASLGSPGMTNTVFVHWGTSNNGTNLGWEDSYEIGTWTNVTWSNMSHVASLSPGTTYYYTFRAVNDLGAVWASPSWRFTTTGTFVPAGYTTNHLVPHTWLQTQSPDWANDFEAAATNDPDEDGFSTWEEYWSGTDPRDGDSFLKIDAARYDGSNVVLEWQHAKVDPAVPPIAIECRANLATGRWLRVGENDPVDDTNTWSALSLDGGFYRIVATNAP